MLFFVRQQRKAGIEHQSFYTHHTPIIFLHVDSVPHRAVEKMGRLPFCRTTIREHRYDKLLMLVIILLVASKIWSAASAAPTPAEVWQQPTPGAPTSTTTAETPTDPPYRAPEFICRMAGCGRNLRTRQGLKDHLVEVHYAEPTAINVIPGMYERGRFIYSCTECGRSFESIRAFSNHFDRSPHAAAGDLTCHIARTARHL